MEDKNYLETLRLNLIDAYGADNVPDSATFVSKMSNPKYREDVHFNLVDAYGTDNVPDIKTFNLKIGEVEKKNSIGSDAPTGGKAGASETPSIGSSPFLQKAKERVEQGEPTVLSVKKETVKEVGLPSYTPTKEEELKAPTQKQFEQQALPPTYQKESALDISKKQTQVAIERSKALDELIKTKKEAQSSYEKIRNLDKQIESFEPQFEKFKTTAEAFQPDIQEYKNLTSQIAEIKNKSNSFVLEYNNEYQKLAPKLEAYKQIFENEKLPNEKRQDAYENYNGIVSILKNKEKLLDQAVAQNEQGIGDLEARAKSFDETIKKATANQAGFSQLYSQYKSLIDERNKSAEGLGVYEKRMSDAQNQIKQKLFEQSQLEDVRQQKLEKEYSTWQNLLESLPKMGIEAVAGVSDMLNVLGFSGDPESPETRDEIKKETRQNIEKLRKFGDSFITQELPKNYEKFFEGQFSLKKLANVGFNSIASTAPTIAAGLIGGPVAGVAAGAGMAFGESKEIMKEAGLTEEQAEAAAFGLSFPIGLLDNYGAEDFVKLFSKEAVEYSTKIFLKNIAGRTLTKEQLFNEAKNTIGQIIKDGAPQLLKEGVKESGTEVSQGTVNEVAKQVAQEFTGVDLDENMSWSDYLKEQAEVRGEEAIGGFIGGNSMQTIGLGIKSAGEGIFPTFNPSAYQKALELLDPSKMEAFSQEFQQEVQDKVLTQEQADLAFRNIQLIQETNNLIPATINNKDLRTEALNLLIEKKETQKEIEGKDEALVAPQKARIEEINKRLSDIANGKEEEVVIPTVTLNKNTTPTEEKYGTIDRGDGKGVVDLTRAEYEAEVAKQGGVEREETPAFETDKTESRQPIDLSIEPTAPTEGVEAGQEQVIPTNEEEKGKSSVPSKTDKAYQEAQGVTERVSKAHPEASVLILPKGDDLSLTALYVGKEKRGKGIGSGVLESVKAEADKLGKKVVLDATNELDNDTDLERLGEFYERNGFVKVGENKFEYTPKKNQLSTPNINQNEAVNENVREIGNGQKDGQKGDVSQEAKSGVQEEEVTEGGVTAPSLTSATNEKTTQKENGQPLPEGVSSVRTETEERKTSAELRAQEEEVKVNLFKQGDGGTRGVFEGKDGQLYKSIEPQEIVKTDKGFVRQPIKDVVTDEYKILSELQSNPHIPKVGKIVNTTEGKAFEIEKLDEVDNFTKDEYRQIQKILNDLNDKGYHVGDKVSVMKRPKTGELVVVDFSAGYKGDRMSRDAEDYMQNVFEKLNKSDAIQIKQEDMAANNKDLAENLFADESTTEYYLTQRPPSIGTHPTEGLKSIEEAEYRGKKVWKLTYDKKLSADQIYKFELTPKITNKEYLGQKISGVYGKNLFYVSDIDYKQGKLTLVSELNGKEISKDLSFREFQKGIDDGKFKVEQTILEPSVIKKEESIKVADALKTEQEKIEKATEVRSTIDNAVANFYAINEATKRSEKREAAKEFRQNLEKMPTVKNVFDNIKSIFAQLEAEGIITKSKDCP